MDTTRSKQEGWEAKVALGTLHFCVPNSTERDLQAADGDHPIRDASAALRAASELNEQREQEAFPRLAQATQQWSGKWPSISSFTCNILFKESTALKTQHLLPQKSYEGKQEGAQVVEDIKP